MSVRKKKAFITVIVFTLVVAQSLLCSVLADNNLYRPEIIPFDNAIVGDFNIGDDVDLDIKDVEDENSEHEEEASEDHADDQEKDIPDDEDSTDEPVIDDDDSEEEIIDEESSDEESADEESDDEEVIDDESTDEDPVDDIVPETVIVERKVSFTSSHGGMTVCEGTEITLTAHLEGFEGCSYTILWQYTDDRGKTIFDAGTGSTLVYRAGKENVNRLWRVVVILDDNIDTKGGCN